jgi:glycosyltransferase involved in cell wall biosynthesis
MDAPFPIPFRVSVLIPTRNRPASLQRLLHSLAEQPWPLHEVLIVDASDAPLEERALLEAWPSLPLRVLRSAPSVCAQRNAGVAAAGGTHVFLCDDDMEVPPDYLPALAAWLRRFPCTGAVTGMVAEPDENGTFRTDMPVLRPLALLWNTVFQLTVWADVEGTRLPWPLASLLRYWYRRRGNTRTLAGWPLVTQVRAPVFRTALYGLGAALIRRSWLLDSPYDETLGPHGIGDNYGVALGFPGTHPLVVLREAAILHHRDADNRLPAHWSHVLRILAMARFRTRRGQFPAWKALWLLWSISGNALRFALRGNGTMLRASLVAARRVLFPAGNDTILRNETPFRKGS